MPRCQRLFHRRELTLFSSSLQPAGRQSTRRRGKRERSEWAPLQGAGAPGSHPAWSSIQVFSIQASVASPPVQPRRSPDRRPSLVHTPRYQWLAPPLLSKLHKRCPSEVHLPPLNSRKRQQESRLRRGLQVATARLKLCLSTSSTPCWKIRT
jgi:hypothetical protein